MANSSAIFMFAPEGWIIADNQSADLPCQLCIDALEDSTITVFAKDFDKETHNVRLLINRLFVLQQRIVMLMSAPAIERYKHFVETYLEMIQRIPKKMIASYLGITPVPWERMKGQ